MLIAIVTGFKQAMGGEGVGVEGDHASDGLNGFGFAAELALEKSQVQTSCRLAWVVLDNLRKEADRLGSLASGCVDDCEISGCSDVVRELSEGDQILVCGQAGRARDLEEKAQLVVQFRIVAACPFGPLEQAQGPFAGGVVALLGKLSVGKSQFAVRCRLAVDGDELR